MSAEVVNLLKCASLILMVVMIDIALSPEFDTFDAPRIQMEVGVLNIIIKYNKFHISAIFRAITSMF